MRASIVLQFGCVAALSAQATPAPQPVPSAARLAPTTVVIPAVPLGRWTPSRNYRVWVGPWIPGGCGAPSCAAPAIGRGVALIPAAHTREIERDHQQDNDFRQDDTFFYFTSSKRATPGCC